ncbi:glycosyltransferase [Streptomyces sp. NPDC051219]|uniref:glycosyltransferase n=1 Tax=Streptomyces sp. NPDC051219 TaxID=3155283 RepID=UPI0034140FEC
MSKPDVTVVVAVYNTMPALTECLESLVKQSIGLDRMEIVAVDDGSTDGGGKELDRYAERYPGTFKVIHQANSGGPAAPSNRALDVATGRYVFFVGSDDYLGRKALQRMVAMADRHDSDIVLGKMVAVGDRSIPRAVFRSTQASIPLIGSGALYAISNTKLYRRALIEKHGLRFSEKLPVSSDMPFTLEAYVRAKTISVVADYDCYYAVRRTDDSNITYRARFENRLLVCGYALDRLDELVGPGELYDAFATRLLKVDLAWIFGRNFLAMDAERREECVHATARFLGKYYGDGAYERMEHQLTVPQRLRFRWVLEEDAVALAELVRMDSDGIFPPTLIEGDRAFARYPGFRNAGNSIPDFGFELTDNASDRLGSGVELESAEWYQADGELSLDIVVRTPFVGDTDSVVVRLVNGAMPRSSDKHGARRLPEGHKATPAPGELTREPCEDGTGTVLRAQIPIERRKAVLGVRVHADVAGSTYEIPVRTVGRPLPLARRWRRDNPYRISANANPKGRLVITTAPLWEPAPGVGERLRDALYRSKLRPLLSRLKRKITR